jgi:hypothetical protein
MTQNNVIHTTLKKIGAMEQLVAEQVGRVYALKKKRVSAEKAENQLAILGARLAVLRARYSSSVPSVTTYHLPKKLLRETAEIGGPRWRIGWGGIS